ncbi:hypothetical protein L2D08_23085 [Domibacillus sp. PGB-M46]|uniref:hypothetical protein n=1 Tax=Domibacillus sp. PGB-M46 TaxID=2910255 RepID=UPI001F570423|nr:hypothetical protein [Domibacillus sp. PGB-M46]MCI2257200.1 hypothetical protein [Domibacillus sp. PGB-M46]
MNRVPLYVINNFLKFDRKIYHLFGLQLGRPIRLKAIFYFFFFGLMIDLAPFGWTMRDSREIKSMYGLNRGNNIYGSDPMERSMVFIFS